METERHRRQIQLLIDSIEPWLARRREHIGRGSYVGGDMFVYFSVEQARGNDFRGPDFFLVLDVDSKERKSWVVWEEGKGPDIVIELLSDSTKRFDKTGKKDIYQDRLRVPEYYWFDPHRQDDFAGFALHNGAYRELTPDADGRLASERLSGLKLTRWHGEFQGVVTTWLRWCTADGELLPTAAEAAAERAARAEREAKQEAERAERAEREVKQEAERAERAEREAEQAVEKALQAERKAERMARRLRELGIDPDSLG